VIPDYRLNGKPNPDKTFETPENSSLARFYCIFVDETHYNMEIFCQKKFAVRLIYDTTTTKYKFLCFILKSSAKLSLKF
jgi:hypothetical protein